MARRSSRRSEASHRHRPEAGILRNRQGRHGEIARGIRTVVGDRVVAVHAPEVADLRRDARHDLVLNPPPRTPSCSSACPSRSDSPGRRRRRRGDEAEIRVRYRPALAVRGEDGQVALRDEVAVGIQRQSRVTLFTSRLIGLLDEVTELVSANENVPRPTRAFVRAGLEGSPSGPKRSQVKPSRGVMSFQLRFGTALPFGVPPGLGRPVTAS